MARNRSEIIVGLFVLIVLAVAGYIILAIQGNPFEKTFPISAMYTRVSGIKPGTSVSLAGHQIGQVESVVPRPDLRMIEVRMALAESYQSAILNDATATIVPVGFLGDVMVEITYGRLGVPIRPGEILEGGEPFDWQHMIKGAASDFSHAMQSVDRVVGNEKYQEDLGKILDNLSRFTDTLNNLVIPEDRAQLDQIFASLKEMSGKIGDAAGSLQALIEDNRENLSTSLANARTISEQVKGEVAPQFSEAARTFADLGTRMTALTEKIDTFVEANSVNAGEAITGIKESTRSLRETLDTAKTSLERLNEGPGTLHDLLYREETSRELNATLRSARGFFEKWTGLGDGLQVKVSAEAKWFFDDPLGDHSRQDFRTVITQPPPGIDIRGYSETWSDGDANRAEWDVAGQVWFGDYGILAGIDDAGFDPDLDLLFLGKVPSSGGRLVAGFGILEGEAGARLEAHLIPDLLYLRLDGIGFTTDDKERLDLSLRAQVWENLHILGGFESLVGSPERRAFAGLRYEFGKKFGAKEESETGGDDDTFDSDYSSEVEKSGYESTLSPGKDPFSDDESLWEKKKGQELIPAEEAPSIKPLNGL